MEGQKKTGFAIPDYVPWGTHLCQFYETSADLLEILVSHFQAGLEDNEACVWIISEPLSVDRVENAFHGAIPDLDARLTSGQMQLVMEDDSYLKDGRFDFPRVVEDWRRMTQDALDRGFGGLRICGNSTRLPQEHWEELIVYEQQVQDAISDLKLIALCSYSLSDCSADQFLQLAERHDCCFVRRHGSWDCFASNQNKQIFRRLQAHEHALASSISPFVTVDLKGNVTYANPATLDNWGYDEENELLGRAATDFWHDPDHLSACIQEVITTGRCQDELIATRKDGSTFPAEVLAKLAIDDQGNPKGIVASCIDLSERKEAEAMIRASEEKYRAYINNSPTGVFVANSQGCYVEVNRVACQLLGYSEPELLGLSIRDVVAPEDVSTATRAFEEMMISGEQLPCSPQEILNEISGLMRVRADGKGLDLRASAVGDVPDTVISDPVRIRQILVNLLGNAIKFTESGHVEVTMRCGKSKAQGNTLSFDVTDTGIGIPSERVDELFHPFVQAESSTTRRFGGTGLGLAISKRLAKMLGGDIQVESEPGRGSRFRLSIPVELIAKPPQTPVTSANAPLPRQALPSLNCRILLVEDGPDNQRLLSFVLKKAGAEVTLAQNGAIGVEKALSAEPPYDVILMDMQMPVMDGYQATRTLRDSGYTLPIIALTAHAMTHDVQKCLDAGCDAYQSKPINRATLLDTILNAVSDRQLTAGSANDCASFDNESCQDIEAYELSSTSGRTAAGVDARSPQFARQQPCSDK